MLSFLGSSEPVADMDPFFAILEEEFMSEIVSGR
jgi:hypothetical protein